MKCGQVKCDAEAVTAFLWPGDDPILACASCALKARMLAQCMGFTLPFSPLHLEAMERKLSIEVLEHVRDEPDRE